MKDGRTHLAHKAEHAIDLDSGALVAVTLHDADQGDTTTLAETAVAAAEQVEAAHATTDAPGTLEEIVADKGYHSNATLVDLAAVGIRSYISEPDPRPARLVPRTRRPSSCLSESPPHARRPRRTLATATGGTRRAILCASV